MRQCETKRKSLTSTTKIFVACVSLFNMSMLLLAQSHKDSHRWGPTAKIFVACVSLFNMSIFLLAELTTIGGLFENFVGDRSYPIIIIVGLITTFYTAYGGLLVSIITDQAQAVVSIIILVIVTIYVAVEFRQPLPRDLPDNLGPNFSGYSAIFTIPVSLISATVFSEAVWQRVWASESDATLRAGGVIGFISVTIFVFLTGFYGFLAAWGGLINFETTNPNVYLFQVMFVVFVDFLLDDQP